MTTQHTQSRDQYYVFTGPDGWAWCEMFYSGHHVTAPTPYKSTTDAMAKLEQLHPDAIIDELCDPDDMADAMRYEMR